MEEKRKRNFFFLEKKNFPPTHVFSLSLRVKAHGMKIGFLDEF